MSLLGWILAFVFAITVHEAAHAWMADRLGDPTARLAGRLSLNPLVHYDPIGTTLLLVLVFMRSMGIPVIPFGWAKPVRFDPYNLQNPRRDSALISLAGPASNLIVAIILSLIIRITYAPFSPLAFLPSLLAPTIMLSTTLAIFNLIPIHPLDGGKIFIGLLPEGQAHEADLFLRRYGTLILFFLIFPTFGGSSPIFTVLGPVINFILRLLLPGSLMI
ncbi:site-2 protease family protein [Patescibacteria group bacterium]|nr:site-2 protease family protein [Patescibacteria group bacterium]